METSAASTNRIVLLASGVIAAAGIAAYANSFAGPFVFLDVPAIVSNPTIRHLWPLGPVLNPPSAGGLAVGGRPLVNLSLALNYALGGTNVVGYHAFNLAVHILAALTLFGILRRTLKSIPLAFATALLWTVHPLQTESVTYIIERAESLMGMFYLLTLYFFIRSVDCGSGSDFQVSSFSPQPSAKMFQVSGFKFQVFAVAACLCGAATKEVAATAPLVVFLYDRTFVSGTFREAWRRHWRLHLGLASSWILSAALLAGTGGNRGGTSGFGIGVSWGRYALTQFPAITGYLRLALWPSRLDFHYGAQWVEHPAEVIPQAILVLALLAGSVACFFQKGVKGVRPPEVKNPVFFTSGGPTPFRALGFAGIFFFAILAPTSLVPGMTQTMAEHRMYLALAPLLCAITCLAASAWDLCITDRGHALRSAGEPDVGGRVRRSPAERDEGGKPLANCIIPILFLAVLSSALITLTIRRNETYRSGLILWRDTAAKRANNAFAITDLGAALLAEGQRPEAITLFEKALRIDPFDFQANYNLGIALVETGHPAAAMGQYERAILVYPGFYRARNNLGVLLTNEGRLPEAIEQLTQALKENPDLVEAHINLGIALTNSGRTAEAIAECTEALRLSPDSPVALCNLANALDHQGRVAEAAAGYERALRLDPDYAEARNNLGVIYSETGRLEDAVLQYQAALRAKPDLADAHENFGTTLVQMNRLPEAAGQFMAAVKLEPGNAKAQNALGGLLFQLGRAAEAIPSLEEAVRLKPDYAEAHANLGGALANTGRLPEAISHLEEAIRVRPGYAEARSNLAVILAATGRLAEAISQYEQALRIQPRNPAIRANYAVVLEQAGRHDEAAAQNAEAARLRAGH